MNLKILNYVNKKIEEHELVRLAQIGNQTAIDVLIKSYSSYIKTICNSFYVLGAEKEDIHQEATIGFYRAICKYDLEPKASFKTFAFLCIKQQIYKVIQESLKPKHKLHLNSISLDQSIIKDSKKGTILDVFIDDYANNHEKRLLKKEE